MILVLRPRFKTKTMFWTYVLSLRFPSFMAQTHDNTVMNDQSGLRCSLKALLLTIVLMSVTNVTNGTEVEMNEEL